MTMVCVSFHPSVSVTADGSVAVDGCNKTTRGAGSDQMKIARNGQGKGIMEIDQRPVPGHQLANPVVFLSVGSGILTKNV